jgi:hypothetical protein
MFGKVFDFYHTTVSHLLEENPEQYSLPHAASAAHKRGIIASFGYYGDSRLCKLFVSSRCQPQRQHDQPGRAAEKERCFERTLAIGSRILGLSLEGDFGAIVER